MYQDLKHNLLRKYNVVLDVCSHIYIYSFLVLVHNLENGFK